MNAEVKKLWVDALRSGEYEQCKNALKANGGYCCLGVLNQLYVDTHGVTWEDSLKYQEEVYTGDPFKYKHQDEDLPPKAQKWAGLDSSNPSVNVGNRQYYQLATLNDTGIDPIIFPDFCPGSGPLNFSQIADLIEKEL